MAATTFILEGESPSEVKRKIASKLKEAESQAYSEDRRSKILPRPVGEGYFVVLRVHS